MSRTSSAKLEQRRASLRALILSVAQHNPNIGELVRTEKWGQESYLPKRSRVGTTVRLDVLDPHTVGLFVHCQTTLIDTFRSLEPELDYRGNRCIAVPVTGRLPRRALQRFVDAALTYHLNKRARLKR